MRKVSTYKMAFTLLTATSLLAGCSGDDFNGNGNVNGNNSNTITFNTNVSNFSSKATIYDNSNLESFTCTAYNATTTTAFIEPTQVEWTGSMWQFAQDQYWPGASGLDFFAYMPATAPTYISDISYSTARQPQFVCTGLPTTTEDQKTLKEFVCALAKDKTKANSSEGVRMTFQHTFAKLLFELNPASDGITINSITIAPSTPANVFKTGGTCTYNNTNGKWEWSSLTGAVGSIVASLNTPFLVIPNNYQSTEFKITVNVIRSSISTTPMNMSATIKYDNKDLMNWKAGYVYKFSLTFTPEILIVDTDKWAEQW